MLIYYPILTTLVKLQKRAARIILDQSFDSPSEPLFKQLKWMKFHDRVDYKKMILVYKALNGLSPAYISDIFKYTHNIGLRSYESKQLNVPKPNLEFFRKSLSYSGSQLWNEIPIEIRSSSSLQSFKSKYLKWKLPNHQAKDI